MLLLGKLHYKLISNPKFHEEVFFGSLPVNMPDWHFIPAYRDYDATDGNFD